MCETLREPVKVLKSLSEKTTNKEYKFKRLYRNLYNPEFYFLAYKNISQSQGSITPGVDGKSLDGMSEKRINALIESLKDFSYQPNPARRVYIEKKNSTKKRPLGIPSTEDKLVQEVVKMILESIYEPNFSDYSHGFRPNRSCHSALQQIQNQFTGITWFVEGDIHACFDSFDHHVLVNILRERIEDENFLALIWKMLKAGYMEQDGELAVLSGSNQYSVSDQVIRGGVKIQKRELETKDTKAQGSAILKDAAFAIISLNENPILVEGKLYKRNETVKMIQTGIDGIATTSTDLLPYGKYKLEETKAPEGYLTDGAKAIEFSITENGKIVDLTDESHSIYNQIKRGDLEGVKIGAGTHKRLANVPFKITSKTTGESHIVVTDKNGQFSTASDWASHKKNTNDGKSSEDGIWFGTSEPDDSKGALLYDTYEIEELSCESNKGMKLIPVFEVVVSRNKVTIDLGTLTDEYEKEITIHTTATDKKTGEKVIVAGKQVTIVDTVTLDGLEEGRKYQLKGWQMLKEENAELLIDGKRVESDYTFVADSEKMKVEISYTFDASELGGQNLVTFEELYDLKNPEEPVKVVEHKDIDDEGQTVLITERKISIHTTATDKNGKKEVEAGKDLTIVDTVTLEGLEIGTNYKLSGWQMIKEENAKLLIDGKEVTNDYEFTADKENMEVQIEFTFDGSTLGGKQLVTFEELYDMTNPEEPKKVTEHKDINNEGQTVTIKEVPETPTPETPGTITKTSNPPKTGDTENVALWIAILVLSAAGITGVRIWNKKKQVKRLGIEEKKEEEE